MQRSKNFALNNLPLSNLLAIRSFDAGQRHFSRYTDLLKHIVDDNSDGENKVNTPFVRASSGQRVVDSALNWIAGKASSTIILFDYSVILQQDFQMLARGR